MRTILIAIILLMLFPVAAAENYTTPNETQLQEAGAYDTLSNLNNLQGLEINISGYSFIDSFFTWDENKSDFENGVNFVSTPYQKYWVEQTGLGYWFYVVLVFVTTIIVYGKSKSFEATSMTIMLMSVIIIIPSLASVLILPVPVLVILSVFATLGFAGVLLSLFGGE